MAGFDSNSREARYSFFATAIAMTQETDTPLSASAHAVLLIGHLIAIMLLNTLPGTVMMAPPLA